MPKRYLLLLVTSLMVTMLVGCVSNHPSITTSQSSPPAEGKIKWTTFTDGNHINGLLIKGNELWAATAGGVVRWDTITGAYHKYTSSDGLPGDYVQAIAEDGQGNLVCGTFYGLAVFDGTRWKTLSNSSGSPASVSAITPDEKEDLLLNTDNGIIRYDGKTWKPITGPTEYLPFEGGAPAEQITGIPPKIVVDSSGNIWDVETYALSRFDGQKWHQFYDGGHWDRSATNGQGFFGSLNAAIVDSNGSLWLGTSFGLLQFDGQVFKLVVPVNSENPDNPPLGISALVLDRQGRLLYAYGNTISTYDSGTEHLLETNSLSQASITAIVLDNQGNLWCGTSDGIYRFDGQHWNSYRTDDILPDEATLGSFPNNVADGLVIDFHSGNLWLTNYEGVYRYDGKDWKKITKADGLAANTVSCVFSDSHGNMWFGTDGFGVSQFDGTHWKTLTTQDDLSSNRITAIAEDRQGNIWLGNQDNKIDRFDGKVWKSYDTHDILDNNLQSVTSIYPDSKGNLWFATLGGGVMRYDGSNWKTFDRYNGLAGDNVKSMTEDSYGDMWFDCEVAVSRFDGTNWLTFNNISSNFNRPMVADSSGNVWFGTFEGLQCFDGRTWRTFTAADGLPGNLVIAIAVGGQDIISSTKSTAKQSLWIGTDKGVSYYDGQTWKNFTVADGLAINYITDIVSGADGSVWFNNANEISHLQTYSLSK